MSFLKTFVLAIVCFSAPRGVTAQVTIDFRLFQSFFLLKTSLCFHAPSSHAYSTAKPFPDALAAWRCITPRS